MKDLMNFFKPNAIPHSSTVTKDAIRVTEKGIGELKNNLVKSLQLLTDLRSMSVHARNQLSDIISEAEIWDKKAMQAFERAQKKEFTNAEADRIATEALMFKEDCMQQVYRAIQEKEKYDAAAVQMEMNIQKIMDAISQWENDLRELRKREAEVALLTHPSIEYARKELADAMLILERMKEKAGLEHALAELTSVVNACKSKTATTGYQTVTFINPDTFQASKAIELLKFKMMMAKRVREENRAIVA
jgi:phage shock protein A